MNNFITKLDITADLELMKQDLNSVLRRYPWPEEDIHKKLPGNQIGLSYRKGADDMWLDASGSIYNKETKTFLARESDFTEINPYIGGYTFSKLEELKTALGIKLGRIRYMRLMPKRGLSVHPDFEVRYHYVLDTNKYSYFVDATPDGDLKAKGYHIPADGHFYKVDTTREHTVFNGGWEPRIHLVICEDIGIG